MKFSKNVLWECVLLLSICVGGSITSARAERVPIPGGVFYYQSATQVKNSTAAWINPAGIAWNYDMAVQLMADYTNGSIGKSWGVVMQRESMVVGYRYLDNPTGNNYREYLVATGFHLGQSMVMGGSIRYFKDGPDTYYHRTYVNLGVSGHLSPAFDWAVVLSNLNRGKVNGVRSEMEQQYSLTYHLVPGKVMLSVDALFSTGQAFNEAEFIYHAEWMPVTGLYLDGYVDSQDNFQLGLRLNLTQYFMGWQGIFTGSGSHSRSTLFIGSTSRYQPTFLK